MENQNLDCWNEEFSRKIVGNELGTISISPRTRHRHFLEPSVEIYAPNRCRFVRYITFLQQPCSLDSKRNSLLSHLCDHLRDIIRTFRKRAACKSRRKVSNWVGDENMKREILHRTRNIHSKMNVYVEGIKYELLQRQSQWTRRISPGITRKCLSKWLSYRLKII